MQRDRGRAKGGAGCGYKNDTSRDGGDTSPWAAWQLVGVVIFKILSPFGYNFILFALMSGAIKWNFTHCARHSKRKQQIEKLKNRKVKPRLQRVASTQPLPKLLPVLATLCDALALKLITLLAIQLAAINCSPVDWFRWLPTRFPFAFHTHAHTCTHLWRPIIINFHASTLRQLQLQLCSHLPPVRLFVCPPVTSTQNALHFVNMQKKKHEMKWNEKEENESQLLNWVVD